MKTDQNYQTAANLRIKMAIIVHTILVSVWEARRQKLHEDELRRAADEDITHEL